MAFPHLNESFPGKREASREAREIRAHLSWLSYFARSLSDEASVDVKKAAQAAHYHAGQLDTMVRAADQNVVRALRANLAAEGVEWATQADMIADVTAVRDAALAFKTTLETEVPDAATNMATRGVDGEVVRSVAKTAALDTAIQAFRATFD